MAAGLVGLDLGLDHLAEEGHRIGSEAFHDSSTRWFATQQYRFAEPEVVDAAGVGIGAKRPLEVGRVSAGHEFEFDGELFLHGDRKGRQFSHVRRVRDDAVLTREVGADAAEPKCRQPEHAFDEWSQVPRHDALSKVAELDHEDDSVDAMMPPGGGRQPIDDIRLRIEARVSADHDSLGLADHRGPDEKDLTGEPEAAEVFDVVDPRLTQ